MLSKEISIFVSSLIRLAAKSNNETIFENIESKNIGKQLTLSCKKITDKVNSNIYYLVSFNETDKNKSTKKPSKIGKINVQTHYNERIEELEKELQLKSESLQATVEELETSNEELQSSNEELIASNEELQSTNEELQSVNEELYTVNSEHIRKIEELTELTSDVENLLKNTQIGTLYLDQHLIIRKVNDVASKLTNIISSDIGRPLRHLSLSNFDNNLISEIESVSDTLQLFEREIIDNKGKCYLMSIIPYRTAENAVEGIIVTFVNITKRKLAEEKLVRSEKELKRAQQITHIGSWYLDLATNEVKWTEELYKMYGFDPSLPPPPYTEHQKLFTPESWETLSNSITKTRVTGVPYELELKTLRIDGSNGWMWVRGAAELDKEGKIKGLWGAAQDITERKHVESALEKGDMSWWEWDYEHNTVKTGKAKYIILGYTPDEIGKGFEAWTKLIHPDDLGMAMTAMKEHLEGKRESYFVEYRIKHNNGNYLWFKDKGGILTRTENGKPKLLVGIVMNITDEKMK
ncbi:MAG: PAS domain-containing protein [Mariniphaga sp.]